MRGLVSLWWTVLFVVCIPAFLFLAAYSTPVTLIGLAWVWTIGSAIGCGATLILSRKTWLEFRQLSEKGMHEESLTLIAQANFRREIFRFVEFAALLIIGLSVVFDVPNPGMSRLLLVLVVAMLFGNTLLDLRERQKTSLILRRSKYPRFSDEGHRPE